MRDFDVDADRPGRYLTDGARLFRIVAPPAQPPHGGLLAVEDCHSVAGEESYVLRMSADSAEGIYAGSRIKLAWVEVGSVVFQASNSCHGVKNVGTTPATYHIVNWSSPGKLKTNGPAVSCTP